MNEASKYRMKRAIEPQESEDKSGLLSTESVLNLLKLILDGSPLEEVLMNIARLVESQGDGTLCTIWLPDEDAAVLYCAAAPGLPGFIARSGTDAHRPKRRIVRHCCVP